jgi:hypothetical protein
MESNADLAYSIGGFINEKLNGNKDSREKNITKEFDIRDLTGGLEFFGGYDNPVNFDKVNGDTDSEPDDSGAGDDDDAGADDSGAGDDDDAGADDSGAGDDDDDDGADDADADADGADGADAGDDSKPDDSDSEPDDSDSDSDSDGNNEQSPFVLELGGVEQRDTHDSFDSSCIHPAAIEPLHHGGAVGDLDDMSDSDSNIFERDVVHGGLDSKSPFVDNKLDSSSDNESDSGSELESDDYELESDDYELNSNNKSHKIPISKIKSGGKGVVLIEQELKNMIESLEF